jgi:phosphomevalonate kinase
MEKMFEYAVRNKLRFPFRGVVSVEDLWDLSVNDLDTVFKTLNGKIKQSSEESLLVTKTKEDKELTVQIEIVKYIFNVKVQEVNNRLAEKERKEKKQKIMEIMESKKEEALQNKSLEELAKMLEEIG